MKAYTNKPERIDEKRCLQSEIEKGNKARKVSNRRTAKKEIEKLLKEDEDIKQELNGGDLDEWYSPTPAVFFENWL